MIGIEWIMGKLVEVFFYCLNNVWHFITALGDENMSLLSDAIALVVPSWDASQILEYLTAANYYVPLEEALGLGEAVLAAWLLVLSYRVLKSWLPFVSGG
jgi:hypothetical protein